MAARRDHYMPPGLLDSQIATLEVPGRDERVMTFDVSQRPNRIVDEVAAQLAG
jgi:gluconokinase